MSSGYETEDVLIKIHGIHWVKTDWNSDSLPTRSCVYQVNGTSPIYGVDVPMYIGQAVNLKDRIRHHINENSYENEIINKTLRYAECPVNMLDAIESLLISTHRPSLNTQRIKKPSETEQWMMIQNLGERGQLLYEVTNSNW